jgi:glutamine synthetase
MTNNEAILTQMRKGSKDAVQHGTKIDRKLADYIAMGMKEWAL